MKVDKECERLIVKMIRERFPDDRICAEEEHDDGIREALTTEGGFCWVIDPIDGTRNFLHRLPNVSVSIGIVKGGSEPRPVAGVVHAPVFRETFSAIEGGGAYRNDDPIRVSEVDQLSHAALATDVNSREPKELEATLKRWEKLLLANTQNLRVRGSAALEMCNVACGRLEGHFESGLDVWDVAAGMLIVKEAGGAVCNCRGEPLKLLEFLDDGYVQSFNSDGLGTLVTGIISAPGPAPEDDAGGMCGPGTTWAFAAIVVCGGALAAWAFAKRKA